MNEPRRIDPRVRTAIERWGHAPDLESAAAALTEARRTLDEALRAELALEVAEITVEMMIDLLPSQQDSAEERVEVLGMKMTHDELERFSAWFEDLERTRAALDLEHQTWAAMFSAAFERLTGTRFDEESPDNPDALAAARAVRELLGERATTFENRPGAGNSESAGVRGQIAARLFPPKTKKR
jgi:hypothetical protein